MATRSRRRQMEIAAEVNAEENIVGGEPSERQNTVLMEILERVQSTVKEFECEQRASREMSAKVLEENQAL